jgi:hypothetical protein
VRLQRRRSRQAFREENQRLAAGHVAERLHDREERLRRAEAALVAVHGVERLQHPHLALDDAALEVDLADAGRGAGAGAGLRRAGLDGERLELVAPIAQLGERFGLLLLDRPAGRRDAAHGRAHERRIVRIHLQRAHDRLGDEDADASRRRTAHRQVLERGLLAHADPLGRQRVEDQRRHRWVVVLAGVRPEAGVGRAGRGGDDRRRVGIADPDVDPDAAATRHARERADRLHDVVLAQLEVLGREVGHRLAVAAAHDDVDQDRRGDRREGALILAGLRAGPRRGRRLARSGPLRLRQRRSSDDQEEQSSGRSDHHGTSLKVRPRVAETEPWCTTTRSS